MNALLPRLCLHFFFDKEKRSGLNDNKAFTLHPMALIYPLVMNSKRF